MIRIEKIMAKLQTDFVGREILCFEKLSSTNATAKEQAQEGAREGTTIIAETQTEGKGRLNRRWFSPKGGIWLSVILRPRITVENAAKMTLTTSLAVANTIRKLYGLRAQVKWPNDVQINNKKVSGVLAALRLKGRAVDYVIIGIGINANFALSSLPSDLQTTATTLKEVSKKDVDVEELVSVLLKEFEDCYKRFIENEFEDLLLQWRSMASFLGKKVEIVSLKERLCGVAVDVDRNGELIIGLEDGNNRNIVSGDVIVIED